MSDSDGDGTYDITVELTPGEYEYKFISDSNWYSDPDNPDTRGEYGNSVLYVSDPMFTYLLPKNGHDASDAGSSRVTAVLAYSSARSIDLGSLGLTVNGSNVDRAGDYYDPTTRTLTYDMSNLVTNGSNTVSVRVTSDKGEIQRTSTFVYSPRSLDIELLTEDMLYFKENIVVYGRVDEQGVNEVKVTLNGSPAVVPLASDGSFMLPVTLQEGENEVAASVVDSDGKTGLATQSLTLVRDRAPYVEMDGTGSGRTLAFEATGLSPDGLALSYRWSQDDDNPQPLVLSSTSGTAITVSVPAGLGEYGLSVTATDTEGRSYTAKRLITSRESGATVNTTDQHAEWINKLVLYEIFAGAWHENQPTFVSITQRLDDVVDLGVNAIWLTPVFEGEGAGYWTRDYYSLESYHGTEDEFRQLIEAAHSRGIRVILDLVVNHTWTEHPFYQNVLHLRDQSPFADYYLWRGTPGASASVHEFDWSNLPNLNVANPEVKDYLIRMAEYWVREFDVDGYRADVAWGVERRSDLFWQELARRIKNVKPEAYLLAEAAAAFTGDELAFQPSPEHDTSLLFDDRFTSAYDWRLCCWDPHLGIPGVLNGNASPASLQQILAQPYPDQALPLRFAENHDHERAARRFGIQQSKLAHTLVLTVPGVPLIYGGGEVGEMNQFDRINWSDPNGLRPYFKKLVDIRKSHIYNDALIRYIPNSLPSRVYSYATSSDSSFVVTLLNFGSQEAQASVDLSPLTERSTGPYSLTNLFQDTRTEVTHEQLESYAVTLSGYQAGIYLLDIGSIRNQPPVSLSAIPDMELRVGGDHFVQNLSTVFSDPDNDSLQFSASSSDTGAVTVSIDQNTLTTSAVAVGSATVTVTASDGWGGHVEQRFDVSVPGSVANEPSDDGLPTSYSLKQNYPNPFTTRTTVSFDLPRTSYVALSVYDTLGREVSTLARGDYHAGRFQWMWDATGLPSGVYTLRLQASEYSESRQMLIVK